MKSSSPIITAVVCGIAVFLIILFGVGSRGPSDRTEPELVPQRETLAAAPSLDLEESRSLEKPRIKRLALDPPKPVPAAYRTNTGAVFSGLVVDEANTNVAGAELLWMSLEKDVEEIRTSTKTDGRFRFEFAPHELTRTWSAVWILHPAHYAEVMVLGPGEDPTSAFGGTRRLEQAPVFCAFALDASGEHVAGAQVEQSLVLGATPPAAWIAKDGDSKREQALRRFQYTTRTDAGGKARLMPVRRASTLVASLDGASSAPWTGPSKGAVDLTLHKTFEVLGNVRGSFGPETRVRCESVTFGEVKKLGEFLVGKSGEWGPGFLPLLDVDEYVFTLRGDAAASQVRVPREEVTSPMTIDLDCVRGVAVALLVLGPDEAALEGATTTVHWKQERSWQSVGATSGEDGIARAWGVPEGNSYARIHRAGHVSQMIGPFEVVEDMDPIEVRLELAGQIAGRCLRDGEPVKSFQILYWSEDPSQVAREKVTGSEDGSFLIEEAPLGDVTLIGLDSEVANGSPHAVVVLPGKTAEVTIELPRPLLARGQVVDAVTGESIASARLQVMSAYDGRGLAEFGAEVISDASGGFALEGLSSGAGALRVRAEEYIEEFVITHGGAGQEIELGLVALQPSRKLVVQLDGPEGTIYGGYRVGIVGHEHLGVQEASHLGVVQFQDIPNGVIQLNIYHPDDSITAFTDSLRPGDDGRVVVPVASGQRLLVEVLPRPGRELPTDLFVGVGGMRDDGSEVVQWLRNEGMGQFLLESAQPGPTVVRAVALSGEVYAMRRFDLLAGRDTEIQLELGDEDDFVIRVLDSEDLPVSNAMVSIYLPRTDPCFFVRNLVTGSSGVVRVQGFGFSHAQVTVSHETKGSGDVGYVDVEALNGEALVVRLEAPADLRILVRDGGDPIAAATAVLCAVEPLVNGSGFGERTTAQDGSATWESLIPGEYELFVHGVGLWPARKRIEADANGHRQVFEVRRTGQLSILLFSARGHSIAGAEIELHCAELNASLAGWIAAGLLPGATTFTDFDGRLTPPPLPHGTWTWSAIAPDGRTGSGVVVLPPGELVEVVGLVQ